MDDRQADRKKPIWLGILAAAAALAVLILIWRQGKLSGGERSRFQKIPGIGVTDEGTAYLVEAGKSDWEAEGWSLRLEEGFAIWGGDERTGRMRLRMCGECPEELHSDMTNELANMALYQEGERLGSSEGGYSFRTGEGDGGIQTVECVWDMEGISFDLEKELSFAAEIAGEEAFTFSLEEADTYASLEAMGMSDEDGTGGVLIEANLTGEGLEVVYYPYVRGKGMTAGVPEPGNNFRDLPVRTEIRRGDDIDCPDRYGQSDSLYSEAAVTIYPAEAMQEGAQLHVPYLLVWESISGTEEDARYTNTGIIIGESEDGRESSSLPARIPASEAEIWITDVEELSHEEAAALTDIELGEGRFYRINMDVEEEEGWYVNYLAVGVGTEDIGTLYYRNLAVPVIEEGKFTGMLCVTAPPDSREEGDADQFVWVGDIQYLYQGDYKINLF